MLPLGHESDAEGLTGCIRRCKDAKYCMAPLAPSYELQLILCVRPTPSFTQLLPQHAPSTFRKCACALLGIHFYLPFCSAEGEGTDAHTHMRTHRQTPTHSMRLFRSQVGGRVYCV